jgi:hypothetical protein
VNQIKTADALPQAANTWKLSNGMHYAKSTCQLTQNTEKHRAYMLAFVTAIIAITDDIPLTAKRNARPNQ